MGIRIHAAHHLRSSRRRVVSNRTQPTRRRQLYRVEDRHILGVIEQMFSHIAPDGTLAPDPAGRRPPRRPRFVTAGT
ncbi:MAG: hypothetical protein ABI429_09030 [Jatrophihabitantaceae bacterium]